MLEVGQVIWLKIRFNNQGVVADKAHPLLIVEINDGVIDVLHLDSIKEETRYKALFRNNIAIWKNNPIETVIFKDSYAQLDNIFNLEYFDDLEKTRKTTDKLSNEQLYRVLNHYKRVLNEYIIDDNKIVYMDEIEIRQINNM